MSVKRRVVQYDDYGNMLSRFGSIQEAQEIFGCTHISSVCRGKRLHDKGYVWRYELESELPRRAFLRARARRHQRGG